MNGSNMENGQISKESYDKAIEQAKELLSEELPPGMRKIIEGMSGMSRIDEIKGRLRKENAIYLYCPDGEVEENEVTEDVQYLLSRLEIAEKALEYYADIENHQPKTAEKMWDSNLYEDRGKNARQALQQLRK